MKKTVTSPGPQRRLVLAHETLRKLGTADLTHLGGGDGGAIDTTKASFLRGSCTMENTVCVGQGCTPATDTCHP